MILQNRQGKTRLSKWYVPTEYADKAKIEQDIHRLISNRDTKWTNFIEFRTYRVIYRRYAGLYFTLGVDVEENQLSTLETIHLFVETLDQYFQNVCELDIVFNFYKVYMLLDEYILAGEVQEMNKKEIMDRMREMDRLEKEK